MVNQEQYNRAVEVIEGYDLGVGKYMFKNKFPTPESLNKEGFMIFMGQFIDDASEWEYIQRDWEFIETGDDSVYDDQEIY